MTTDFDRELAARLQALREQGLRRELREVSSASTRLAQVAGESLLNFSSNDYLGLAAELSLKEAAREAVARFGAGSTASRLICGSLSPHHELEQLLASFKGTPAALTFSSGYTAALGAICALAGKEDILILDKLVHASIVDAARLSGAKLRVFAHNDLADLEDKLDWARRARTVRPAKVLVLTESVFSMDGDQAPLREIIDLKEKYGAWLMLDEAHATGLLGPNRRGLADELGVGDRIEIQMGTLGKALGAAGGYICGSRHLVDYLVNRARSFIFSTAPVPAAAAAAAAGVRVVQSAEGALRRNLLWQRVTELLQALGRNSTPASAILPVPIGAEVEAVDTAAKLRERGVLVAAVRFPSVPRGRARLRLTLSASHTAQDVRCLADKLREVCPGILAPAHAQPAG